MTIQRMSTIVLAVTLFAAYATSISPAEDKNKEQRLLRHVVLFTFNDDATEQQVDEIVKAFGELPSKVKEIHGYEWGTNNSPEGLNKGHTHAFLVTFKSEADRDAYLPHPAHKEFVTKLKPILKDVTVIDYWASH